jgi:hypothetical protein
VRDLVGVCIGVCICTKSSVCVDGGGRMSSRCLDFARVGAFDMMGADGSKVSGLSCRLGAPTSRLARLSSKRWPGLVGVLGGVASAASISGSSWMTLDVSEAYVLGSRELASVDTPESAPSLCFRRSTTRFLRFRTWPVRDRLAPKLSPADKEFDV